MSILGRRAVPPHRAGRAAGAGRPRSGDAVAKLLDDVAASDHASEAMVVSTCNRVEVYAEVDKFHGGARAVSELLARQAGVDRRGARPAPLRALRGPRRRAPVLGRLRAGLDGRRREPDPRPGPGRRSAPPGRTARSAGSSTISCSRRCGSASGPARRPASTGPGARSSPPASSRRPPSWAISTGCPGARRRRRGDERPGRHRRSRRPARLGVVVANRTPTGPQRLAAALGGRRGRARPSCRRARRGRPRRLLHRRRRSRAGRRPRSRRSRSRRPAAGPARPRAAARRRPGRRDLRGVTLVDLETLASALADAAGTPPTSEAAARDRRRGGRRLPRLAARGQRRARPWWRCARRPTTSSRPSWAGSPAGCPTSTPRRATSSRRPCAGRRQAAARAHRAGQAARRRARRRGLRRRAARAVRPRPQGRRGRDGGRPRRRGESVMTSPRSAARYAAQRRWRPRSRSWSPTPSPRAPAAPVELVAVTTYGDASPRGAGRSSAAPASSSSALREALLAGEIDFAVHSLKDLPDGTAGAGSRWPRSRRARTPRDVLVARDGLTLAELPAGATVGTGSPRRAAQLRALGLDLDVVADPRQRRHPAPAGRRRELDAVVLARAGLARLGRLDEVTEILDPIQMLPAPGQGALAVECLWRTMPRARQPLTCSAPSTTPDPARGGPPSAPCSPLWRPAARPLSGPSAKPPIRSRRGGPELYLRAVVSAVDGSAQVRLSATGPLGEACTDRPRPRGRAARRRRG